jgi:hypothetical protein
VRTVARGDAQLSPSLTRRLIDELSALPDPALPTPEQVINTMDFSARSLRAWAVPYAVPLSRGVADEQIESQLRALGAEVVRVAERL